jgi:two-component system response regulator RpaA
MAGAVGAGDVYSTGRIARALRVSSRTVGKWIDTEALKGYRLPGSNDRRVTRASLERFVRENGMPAEWLAELDAPTTAAEAARVAD